MRPTRLLAALLATLLPTLVLGVSRFHERNHTGLLFLYTFDEGQQSPSITTEVQDRSGRYLMGNLTTSTTGAVTWSAARQGMAIPGVSGGARSTSPLTSAGALSLLTSEFSLEFFFTSPVNPLSQSLLIAGFGDWPPGTPFPNCDAANTVSEGGWRLFSTLGSTIEFSAVVPVNGVPTCVTVGVPITADSLRHLVVRARSGALSMVSHANVANSVPGTAFTPSLWSRHAAPLTVATPHVTTAWTGTLYMIAMYDRYLSTTEIAANRIFGPPNSVPYGNIIALAIEEDARTTLFPTDL